MARAALLCFTCCNLFSNKKNMENKWDQLTEEEKARVDQKKLPLLGGDVDEFIVEKKAHESCKNVQKMIQNGAKSMLRRSNEQLVQFVVSCAKYEEEKPIYEKVARTYF